MGCDKKNPILLLASSRIAFQVNEGPWMGYELSVTRALGHKNIQKYGVTPEPYVVTRDLEPQHFCLVRSHTPQGEGGALT